MCDNKPRSYLLCITLHLITLCIIDSFKITNMIINIIIKNIFDNFLSLFGTHFPATSLQSEVFPEDNDDGIFFFMFFHNESCSITRLLNFFAFLLFNFLKTKYRNLEMQLTDSNSIQKKYIR